MTFNHVNTLPLWASADLSASVNGPWLRLSSADKVSMQVTMGSAGTLNGTWSLAAGMGDDSFSKSAPSGTSSIMAGSSYAVVNGLVGADSTLIVSLSDIPFSWIRWVWTRTSGTGTLTEAYLSLKGA